MQQNLNFNKINRKECSQMMSGCKIKKLSNEIKDMIANFNQSETKEMDILMDIVDKFSFTTEEENNELMLEARKKVAEIFTIDVLKSLDQRFLLSKTMPLLLSAETVSDYEVNEYVTTEDNRSPLRVRISTIQLCDYSEINIINIQEEPNETN